MVMCISSQRRQDAVRCFQLLVVAIVTTDGCEGLVPTLILKHTHALQCDLSRQNFLTIIAYNETTK